MLANNRIIWKDNLTFTDVSVGLSNYLSTATQAMPVIAFEDAIYIGSDFPFNHRWIEIGEANTAASVASVSVWNGSAWKNAVDIIDETSVGGKSFSKSGFISWTPDRNGSWDKEETTEDIAELADFKIYDKYWAKITFSGNFSALTTVRYIGHRFASDEDMVAEYPSLADAELISAFKAGKEDWNDQHFIAAERIIENLRAQGIIFSPSQILNWQQFKTAALHKAAEIIFSSFGADYEEERAAASKAYSSAMKIGSTNIDKNANATLDRSEKGPTVGWLTR